MELRKRKTNISYNNNLNILQESLNEKSDSENFPSAIKKNESVNLKTKASNKRKKINSNSEYEYSSSNNNDYEDIISSDESRVSSAKRKKKKNKKNYKVYNIDSDYDSDGSRKDVITNSSYDPIIQQNATIITPLRTMKKIKFNNIMNEVIDLVGDSDEEMEAITVIDSDEDIDESQQKRNVQKKNEKKVDMIIDLCLDNDDNDEEIQKSYDENKSKISSKKSSDENNEESDEELNIISPFKKRNPLNKKKIIYDEFTDESNNSTKYKKNKKQKINFDDEIIDDDIEDEYTFTSHNNKNNKSNHFLRNSSKNSTKISENEEIFNKNENDLKKTKELEINTKNLKNKNIKNKNEPISATSNFLIELESMSFDDHPSGSIKISSGDSSEDDIVEIISSKKINDEIEISDDDEYSLESQKRRKSLNSLPQSSMKKSIEQRLSRKKKRDQNRLLDFQRLKERKRKPIDSVNPYEDVIGNDDDDDDNTNIISPLRFLDRNDDFVVSDTEDEPVYILTTEWDVKQRKKLYKAFKTLFRFCIGILIGGNFINKNLDNLKKAFQIINKRINYVCKKITPVPPWVSKFQNHVDSYPYMSVISQYPLSKCDSCNKDITSSFAVSFSGKKYNKLSLREMNNDILKDKEITYVIDRVCLERVQIYHELYHFKYNTLKTIEKKMKEKGMNINKLKKSTDENKIENTFIQLKTYCKELYVKLAEKLKNGENYVPNTLDI